MNTYTVRADGMSITMKIPLGWTCEDEDICYFTYRVSHHQIKSGFDYETIYILYWNTPIARIVRGTKAYDYGHGMTLVNIDYNALATDIELLAIKDVLLKYIGDAEYEAFDEHVSMFPDMVSSVHPLDTIGPMDEHTVFIHRREYPNMCDMFEESLKMPDVEYEYEDKLSMSLFDC